MDPASWAVTLGLSTEKLSAVGENALLLVVEVGMHVGLCLCFMTLFVPCGIRKQDVTRKGTLKTSSKLIYSANDCPSMVRD